MLWTGRSCRRRQCWLWRKRKRATGPASAPKLRQNRFKYRATAEALIPAGSGVIDARGLPGYTFEFASGELWRSLFDATRNVILVNNGHRDFVFASRTQALKLRYLVRLYVKELVLRNFSGVTGISFSSA